MFILSLKAAVHVPITYLEIMIVYVQLYTIFPLLQASFNQLNTILLSTTSAHFRNQVRHLAVLGPAFLPARLAFVDILSV